MEQIADALNAHEADALKEMFSVHALERATDFDAGIEYLFSNFPTGVATWEIRNFGSEGDYSGNQETDLLLAYYIVSTEEGDYTFFFADVTVDDAVDRDKAGIYAMGVTPLTDDPHTGPAQLFFAWAGSMRIDESEARAYPGVYVPVYDSIQLSDGMMREFAWEVGSQDSAGMGEKFTDSARATLGAELDSGLEELFGLFPDREVVWQELPDGPVVRTAPDGGEETVLLLSTYRVSSSGKDFWLSFAYFPVNTLDPSNVGVYALGVAHRTEQGDSAQEQALFALADTFDVSASTPPGIFISE